MAYLGQGAEGNFTTTNAKDTFSGNGSTTTFTLSQRGTENNVDVFVNNVRQEPGVAYNIEGNGTSLVFTAAPSTGTNNIYVVNRGPAELSATHPSGQALEATNGTFTGDLTVDTDTLFVDSTNNRVGVATVSPSQKLDVRGAGARIYLNDANEDIDMNSTADGQLRLDGSGYAGAIALNTEGMNIYTNSSSRDIIFGVNETERMRIINSGGITFNGDTAAANALDDYEEGTWTPIFTTSSGSFSSVTYQEQNGVYVKVGRMVVVSFDIRTSALSMGTASGSVYISGFPFAASGTQFTGQCGAQSSWITNAPEYANLTDGASYAFLRRTNGAGYSDITTSNLNTSSGSNRNRILGCSIAYRTT